ncbi:MAG TPA: CheR family methyltransferase [Isosphaeraceae bacterium]|jgi:two-component system CheB/CheR fusion protein|nr:CheR family methyltransferase [Isosphaeraceae bacterium]
MSDDSPAPDRAGFEELLEYLRRSRGFDFTGYKRSSLIRRVAKRMQMINLADYRRYVDFLEVHPDEFGRLFDTILINVTAFFRDPTAWDVVREKIIPRLIAAKPPEDPIRIWSAGCASGEEAYTLAIVLAEALGADQSRDRVKIYATDVDEEALARARQSIYDAKHVEGVPPELLAKYFEPINGRFAFRKDLRRSVIFGRHDLIQDAPISRIDLLSCRNTLMYLNSETQGRILERFHFALNDRGVLFLGKAETLLTYNNSFVPIDLKHRLFAKAGRGNLRERLLVMARTGSEEAVNHFVGHVRVREAAFEVSPIAQLVVDAGGVLALANDRARTTLGLATSDVGRPLRDLQVSYRPADLRSCLDRVQHDRQPVVLKDVEWSAVAGEPSSFEVHITPLFDAGGVALGAGITFLDATVVRRLTAEHERSTRDLETAYEELQSTNEELETTNEELQSTVEELETTSEELQSTNEELETMNEELQSTNEELETVNEELRERSDEVKRVNLFLESILSGLRGGVAVLDRELLILVWSPQAENLWGIRAAEARGKNLLNLEIGLPVDRLKPALRACLSGESPYQEVALEAVNRRGRSIHCNVMCTPMVDGAAVDGVILVMEDSPTAATESPSPTSAAAAGADGSPGPAAPEPSRD